MKTTYYQLLATLHFNPMKQYKLILIYLLVNLFICKISYAQNVGINPTGAIPHASAMLDVSATDKGMLIPRVSLTSTSDVTTIANPVISLLVYNTNASMVGGSIGFYYWSGSSWTKLTDANTAISSSSLWSATGNNISNTNSGNVGIGINSPSVPLHIGKVAETNLPHSIYNGYLMEVSEQITDTSSSANSNMKIGLYSAIKNHSIRNVSVLGDAVDTNNHSNYGIWGNVSKNPGPLGESFGLFAYDQVNAPNTFASYTYGKAVYTGVDNSNATNAVLTNAGNGLMQWSKPVAFLATGIANNTQTLYSPNPLIPNYVSVVFETAEYDLANAYNGTTSTFTVPTAGIYHFDYVISIYVPNANNYGTVEIGMNVNNVYKAWTGRTTALSSYIGFFTITGSTDINLNAGDTVTVRLTNNTSGQILYSNIYGANMFSGHLVR